ncbi:hypothetical protein CRYUN_Cryun01aG0158400 [Craigia yunnanensis]
MEERKQGDLEVLNWFTVHVIESKLEPSIEHQELCSLLSLRVKDEHISLLINAGLLTRQLIDQWDVNICLLYSIPSKFIAFKCFDSPGLLAPMTVRRYKEMLLAPLEKKRLRLSPLDMRFHLRDLIGSGNLKTAHTPTGIVVFGFQKIRSQEDTTSSDIWIIVLLIWLSLEYEV